MFIYHFIIDYLKKRDLSFITLILILQTVGLVTLYSATHGAYAENIPLFKQQIFWFLFGWGVFFLISHLNYSIIIKSIWPLYFFHLILLTVTLVAGKDIAGTKRWIDLGFFNYQPSETLKFIIVLVVAYQLSKRKFRSPFQIKDLIFYASFILTPILIIAIQPDLGTSGIILLTLSVMILFNGIQKKLLLLLSFIFLISFPVAWNFGLKPYQKSRITTFLQPGKDPRGSGYNIIQSKIAIGSGKFLGKGFGKGTQNQLQFLPERHTDFIFSVLSEEHGLLGSSLTLVLFFLLIAYLFKRASTSRDRFSCYLYIGSGSFFLWHILLNTAMTMGLFPIVGAPLSLFSYGGSHTITSMSFLGIIAFLNKRKDFFYTNKNL